MASFLEKTEKTSKKLEQSPDINRLFNGMVIQQQRLNSSLRSSKVSSLLGQYAENRSFKGVTPEINKDDVRIYSYIGKAGQCNLGNFYNKEETASTFLQEINYKMKSNPDTSSYNIIRDQMQTTARQEMEAILSGMVTSPHTYLYE